MTPHSLNKAYLFAKHIIEGRGADPDYALHISRAFLHLYQSSLAPISEEAQPGPTSPSAPAAAYWPCWAVEEDFDANEADSKWDRYAI